MDICNGIVINRRDLVCNHEEDDVTMTYLFILLVKVDPSATVVLICNDSDVFVYFCHFYHTLGMSNNVFMKSIKSSKLYDIGKLCQNNQDNTT